MRKPHPNSIDGPLSVPSDFRPFVAHSPDELPETSGDERDTSVGLRTLRGGGYRPRAVTDPGTRNISPRASEGAKITQRGRRARRRTEQHGWSVEGIQRGRRPHD